MSESVLQGAVRPIAAVRPLRDAAAPLAPTPPAPTPPMAPAGASVHTLAPARRPDAAPRPSAAPFLKWAGGKTQLLGQLKPLLPASFDRYFEPFLGGGAMFFNLAPAVAFLSDVNDELINVYRVVRDDVESLIAQLGNHKHEKNHYYAVRALDPRFLDPVERAARMVYLNRTCFNGLYRVNRRGQFNVPFGSYKNPDICPADKLRAASATLQGVPIERQDFATAVAHARAGDFVYFDPPYDPVSRTASFTRYAKGDFGPEDQAALAETFAELTARGVHCMLSNSDTPLINELYADFRVERVQARRAISRRAGGRGPVSEVVVLNY